MDVKSEVGGGKGGGGSRRDNFRAKNYTHARNTDSQKSEIDELEMATYIVSQIYLADQYEKATKAIYRYFIRKLPAGVELAQGMRDGMLPRFPLPTNPKIEPVVDAKEYEIILYEWKITAKNKPEKRIYVKIINQKLFAILVEKCLKAMGLKLEGTKGYEQVEADEDVIALIKLIEKIMVGVEESLQQTMVIVMEERTLHTFFQNMGKSNNNYKIQFGAYVMVLEAYCGGVNAPQIVVDTKLKELYPLVSDMTTADAEG